MRFSPDTAFVVLALAQVLVGPVIANDDHETKRHLFRRASSSFHKSAIRHSAGLARDLRIAFKGLSQAEANRVALARRSSSGDKPFCVSNPGASTSPTNNTLNNSGHSTTSQKPSSTGAPGASPTAQSNFRLVQSYVRVYQILFDCVPSARRGKKFD
jgi:hypothetical protein